MEEDARKVLVTPADAAYILEHECWPLQRALRPHKIDEYVIALQQGTLVLSPIDFCVLGDKRQMVNGQHRTHAVKISGISTEFIEVIHPVQSADEIGEVYARLSNDAPKTAQDRIRALTPNIGFELAPGELRSVSSAARLIIGGFKYVKTTGRVAPFSKNEEFKFEVMRRHYHDGIVKYFNIVNEVSPDSMTRLRFLRASVVAVGIVTCQYQPTTAEHFWNSVVGNMADTNTPERRLTDFLLVNAPKTRIKGVIEYASYVVNAWNRAYRGEEAKALRDSPIPLAIEGTPYNGQSNPDYVGVDVYTNYL